MKCNAHFTFQGIIEPIDYRGVSSDARMAGAILPFNVQATRGFSSDNCVTKSELGFLSSIRDQDRTKKQ